MTIDRTADGGDVVFHGAVGFDARDRRRQTFFVAVRRHTAAGQTCIHAVTMGQQGEALGLPERCDF